MSRNLGVERHLAWDFEEFGRHVDAVARGLIGMGVGKGDRVGVIMGNTRFDEFNVMSLRNMSVDPLSIVAPMQRCSGPVRALEPSWSP